MDTHSQKKIVWHEEILPVKTKKALFFLSKQPWLRLSKWYLAGGTALALQVGHRKSLDLDFFTPAPSFRMQRLISRFPSRSWQTNTAKEGTVYGELYGAKVSFIAYPFFKPAADFPHYGCVRVLNERDIAVMEIMAISQRGRKRDFFDLYWYAQYREPLLNIMERLPRQYPEVAHDFNHILKSLVYFEDAEGDPMPSLVEKISWPTVKKFFQNEVPRLTRKLLGFL